MSDCTHDCGSCGQDCPSRITFEKQNEFSFVKKVIGVVSGKGGVGKSLVTSLLAVGMARKGNDVAILDADVTGPSIPKAFGVNGGLEGDQNGLYPAISRMGVKIVSSNLLLEDETDPVIWRGPVIAGMVKQFWTDVVWDHVDYMFVDMPPGTGDVPLTVFQSIKLDGIIIVTSPQELVSMIVEKAVKMANKMNIKILGVVENMSYIKCPDCGKEINLFGASKLNDVAKDFNLKVLGRMPMDANIAKAVDAGEVETLNAQEYLQEALREIEK
ncbi:MAG: Mrp/NBP35 family ATP-binding protein [Clostridia bacterium]|nr:Mrp/NBP35 family ATP-binding protein [Clostridia bacterium]